MPPTAEAISPCASGLWKPSMRTICGAISPIKLSGPTVSVTPARLYPALTAHPASGFKQTKGGVDIKRETRLESVGGNKVLTIDDFESIAIVEIIIAD